MQGRLSAVLAVVALGALIGAGTAPEPASAAPPGRSTLERALFRAVNDARIERGLPALRPNWTLARPARGHSIKLARDDRLDHDSANGAPFWTRLVAAGYPRNRWMGENLAMVPGCTAAAAREVVRLWLGSPGHRANLLSRRFKFVGTGAAKMDRNCSMVVFTADFGG